MGLRYPCQTMSGKTLSETMGSHLRLPPPLRSSRVPHGPLSLPRVKPPADIGHEEVFVVPEDVFVVYEEVHLLFLASGRQRPVLGAA